MGRMGDMCRMGFMGRMGRTGFMGGMDDMGFMGWMGLEIFFCKRYFLYFCEE